MRFFMLAALLATVLCGAQGRSLAQDGGGGLADWALAEEAAGKPGYWETWVDPRYRDEAQAAPAPAPAAAEEADLSVTEAAGGYTMAEVARHNSVATGAWIVVSGKVYDVSNWVNEHPGGPSAILGVAGTDATQKFARQHGLNGFEADLLTNYYLGDLATGAVRAESLSKKPKSKQPKGKQPKGKRPGGKGKRPAKGKQPGGKGKAPAESVAQASAVVAAAADCGEC